MERQMMENLSFIRQKVSICINPAESDAMWKEFQKWFNSYIRYVKDISYKAVLKHFSEKFIPAMEPMIIMLKEEEEAKAGVLRLPSPLFEPISIVLMEGPKQPEVEASTCIAVCAEQKEIFATELAEVLKGMKENLERRLTQQDEAVRTRLDRQDETLKAQAEASSRIKHLLASLVTRLPPPMEH
jgi:hypothetical protein